MSHNNLYIRLCLRSGMLQYQLILGGWECLNFGVDSLIVRLILL